MEFNKTGSNPMLVGAMELLKAEDSPEHRGLFISEMVKANFMAPVLVNPEPQPNESGELRLAPGSQVQFPMLSAPDGKRFFMAFTDKMEFQKWKDSEGKNTFAITFQDLVGMLFRKDSLGNESQAFGFVINPFGANMVIPKEMVASIMAASVKNGQPTPPQK